MGVEVGLDKDDKTVANVVDQLRASFWVLNLRLCGSADDVLDGVVDGVLCGVILGRFVVALGKKFVGGVGWVSGEGEPIGFIDTA